MLSYVYDPEYRAFLFTVMRNKKYIFIPICRVRTCPVSIMNIIDLRSCTGKTIFIRVKKTISRHRVHRGVYENKKKHIIQRNITFQGVCVFRTFIIFPNFQTRTVFTLSRFYSFRF